MSSGGRLAALALVLAAAHCLPSLGPGDSLVTSTRILAVRADPAEAKPGTRVTFTSFVAAPGGTVTGARVTWDFCTAPKPITEDNVVSNACLGSANLVSAGTGATVAAATPKDGCAVFGPDVGMTGFRPRDPDSTGGFYQPLRADLGGVPPAFALARIKCDLPNADADAAAQFAKAYKVNQNPHLLPLTATMNGTPVALTSIPTSARVTFEASWDPAAAETFASFDATSQSVTTQREAMQVAWYSSAGALDSESTGRSSTDMSTTTVDGWQAPGSAATAYVWLVLRDSRGGIDFGSYEIRVTQ